MSCLSLLSAAACCLIAGTAVAACDVPAPVRLAPVERHPGSVSAEISGGVPRGERDCFTISGQTGQHLSIAQPDRTSTNIVFQLYQPPWHLHRTEDGVEVAGRAMPGAAEGADATRWSGVLPQSGAYLLVVGASWGGGEYRLRLVLH